jgi:hypothetical protein
MSTRRFAQVFVKSGLQRCERHAFLFVERQGHIQGALTAQPEMRDLANSWIAVLRLLGLFGADGTHFELK